MLSILYVILSGIALAFFENIYNAVQRIARCSGME